MSKQDQFSGLPMHLAYCMLFGHKILIKWIQQASLKKIETFFAAFSQNFNGDLIPIIKVCAKRIKSWNLDDLQSQGMYFYNQAINKFAQIQDSEDSHGMTSQFWYCTAQIESRIYKQYHKANIYYTFAIVKCSYHESLLSRIVSLIGLSDNCYLNREYLIGKRVLFAAYTICHGYFFDNFVFKQYPSSKMKFIQKIQEIKCANCGQHDDNNKLKCCKGCMRTFYCNKKCQKKHWKSNHKNKCNKSWKQLYHLLDCCIFYALNKKPF